MPAETVSMLLNLVASAAGTALGVVVQGWMERRRADRGGHLT